ncbi:hypothetical protein MTX78_24985 (plasmid) [Hymenobacter tibetensis]|uniref:Uncharacterized protein n=1 Tax=Hymenobacter tibetensis TaxID=497967 RepID=A0ABY4D8S7_9BACT|nr:hypothetical protein [Hymenobacter tibetensis]UOG77621.1 hypothetical protein MTX78_24985 [Hymenobacter tibetensis]
MPDTLIPTRRQSLAGSRSALNVEQAQVLALRTWHHYMVADAAVYQATAHQTPRIIVSPANNTFARLVNLLKRVARVVQDFSTLPLDWDSYGAQTIQAAAIEAALTVMQEPDFLQLLAAKHPRLAAYPLSNGGVQLDINGGRWPLEIEISPNGRLEFTFFGPANQVLWETYELSDAVNWYAIFNDE